MIFNAVRSRCSAEETTTSDFTSAGLNGYSCSNSSIVLSLVSRTSRTDSGSRFTFSNACLICRLAVSLFRT